jgi:SAM-dependent methyltransferase
MVSTATMSGMHENLSHYGGRRLVEPVLAELLRAGLGGTPVPWRALAPLDQFHVGGAAATSDLAARLELAPGTRVLDVGSGLGGPARHLAAEFGCDVTGIDLNPPFVEIASVLARRTGLETRVRFVAGDATALPFRPARFDLAWTQHVAMNIADRAALYAGIRSALRPGGRLALYDVVATGGPLHYPVPWAREAAASHVCTADETRAALERAGFAVTLWRDATADAQAWRQAAATSTLASAGLRHGLTLVMGPDFPEMTATLRRNFDDGRAALLQAVLVRVD